MLDQHVVAEVATSTSVSFSKDARRGLQKGLDCVADAVGCTLGPRGRTVLISQPVGTAPILTKDGVTVSRSIRLKDPVERLGAELIQEAAARTNDVSGDGTTTATVVTQTLVREGLDLLDLGTSARELCEGLERARDIIDSQLKSMARPVITRAAIEQVATISANGDADIGSLIADAFERVGPDGVITVEDAKGTNTSLDVVEGMQFDRGYLSPYFVNVPEKMAVAHPDCLVMVTDKKLSSMQDVVPVLEHVHREQKALLIIADDVEGEALQGLVLNRLKANLRLVAIKAPGHGQLRTQLLQDICITTGAKLLSSTTGLSLKDAASNLGTTKRVVVDRQSTIIVGDGKTKQQVEARVNELKEQLVDVTLHPEERSSLTTRAARLAGGVAVVRVGGATELEMGERRHRIEDALNATKAAAAEGTVPGGGAALLFAAAALNMSEPGHKVMHQACQAPLRRIINNAGRNPDLIIDRLSRERGDRGVDFGYDALNDRVGDLTSFGIIDPVKVTRSALKHAVSVAVAFLTLDAVVHD